MGMQVQPKMNYQPSFGMAKQVIVENTVQSLGLKAVKVVQEALPDLYKVGDEKTIVTVGRDYIYHWGKGEIPLSWKEFTNQLKITTSLCKDAPKTPEPTTWVGKMIRMAFSKKPEPTEVVYAKNSLVIDVPEQSSTIVNTAKQNIIDIFKEAFDAIKAKIIMAEIQKTTKASNK